MSTRITGASVWEQELFDRFNGHVENEKGLLDEYREMAGSLPSDGFRYLAELIVADEERHHRLFADLAAAVRSMAEFEFDESPVPGVPVVGLEEVQRQAVLEATSRFLAHEREDAKMLDKLAKDLKPVRDTTLWELIVRLMRADTAKHIAILQFIEDRTKHPIV